MSDWIPTTCARCAVGCGHMQMGVDEGYGIDTVRGDGSHPVNHGLACQRGVTETADPDGEWLRRPLVRENGKLVETTWDDALDLVADRMGASIARDPHSVAVLGSGQQTNEAAYALGKFARGGIGTRHYDANTTLCMASAVAAYYQSFGSDAPPCTYDDIPEAQSHIIWGANPAAAHPVMFQWIQRSAMDDDSRLIVVDPVRTETAKAAHRHVQVAPGGDLALARAVLARVIGTDAFDRGFVHRATEGFDDLVADLPPTDEAAEQAGVSPTTVEYLADAMSFQTLIYWGMGINQSVRGTATSRALIDCCLATGNLRPGSGPFSLTGQANSMGTRVCSSKGTWPGHRPFDDPDARATVAEAWGVPRDRLPDDPGPGPVGIVDSIGQEVETVYTVATNPAVGLPDASAAAENLADAFLVTQDVFHTETTDLADVVLPAITWGETDGTLMNMERTVSRVHAATDTPDGVRSDLDIIAGLASRLYPDLLPDPPVDPAEVFAEFASLTAGTPADCSGISYDRLDAEQAVRWPAPDAESSTAYRYHDHDGDDESWSFETPSGSAQFSTVDTDATDLPELTDDDYPLTLTTAREADEYNTGIRTRSVDDPGDVTARVDPATVEAHLDGTTDTVRIESRRGVVPARVEPDPTIPEGMVWLPIHHPMTNDLTVPATDPQSDEPNYKQCAVRLQTDTTGVTHDEESADAREEVDA
ncbi:assimilatory nitrate reductase NasA [Halorientalis litorea]|jgi:assimilatory nitrate reductase catalytic subunit|uniref:assimilatory nitrate reductase NasA n=1 Tax=Halorientalis litorea TaxID=2931977 RepID=UPI001FF5C04E|nr:assimilatory nitrate reductase NasA [Halorientalis litorea]